MVMANEHLLNRERILSAGRISFVPHMQNCDRLKHFSTWKDFIKVGEEDLGDRLQPFPFPSPSLPEEASLLMVTENICMYFLFEKLNSISCSFLPKPSCTGTSS